MELRFLDSGRRLEGARYIADNRLSGELATVLARAIKEQQRRGTAAAGFSGSAGDCLAFKYYRDAQECRDTESRKKYIGVMSLVASHATTSC
jgi:predicted alpha/beta hydrolase